MPNIAFSASGAWSMRTSKYTNRIKYKSDCVSDDV